jgi:hypothetical protein
MATDQDLREIMATLAMKHATLTELQAETKREMQETNRSLRKTMRELGKQIGGLGEKFGSFTEGLALPSMKKILSKRFGMEFVAPYVERWKGDRVMELDVLAYSNSTVNQAYVVEVKSHLRQDGIQQMKQILRDFREFFPEHADKEVYGILAAVHIPEKIREKVLREGLYLARIHDGQFELQVPEDFQPRAF